VQPQPQRRVNAKKTVKIGRPGYRVTKQFEADAIQRSLLFQVQRRWWNEYPLCMAAK
jgi:splicing factor 3A subunit 2